MCCLSLTSHQPTYVHIDGVVDYLLRISQALIINPRHACAARVTLLCLFVCLSVCYNTPGLSVVDRTLNFRHQRSADDTLECSDSWILLTMLASRDMAKFVSQEDYERASLPETSAHMINHMLLQFVIDHVLFFQSLVRFCVSERFPVGELSHLPKSSGRPLCRACPGCGD